MNTVISAVILLSGPIVACLFAVELVKSLRLWRFGETTQGKIIDIRWGAFARGRPVAYPTVEFRTSGGRIITYRSAIGRWPAPGKVGDIVPIRYLPNHPEICAINSFGEMWFSSILLGVISVPLLALAWTTARSCTPGMGC